MALIKQGASYTRSFLMVGTSDHITGATAASPKLNISRAGGALSSTNAVIAELGVGLYTVVYTSTDTRTMGDLLSHFTGTGADPVDFVDQIVGFDPVAGTMTSGTVIDKSGYTIAGTVTAGTVIDKSGYTLAGTVTAGTVLDKTGYALTQGFPANFAAFAITAGGAVTVGTNNDKTGYALSQSFPSNFGSMLIDSGGNVTASSSSSVLVSGSVTVGTNNDKTGYSLTPQERGNIVASTWSTVQSESYSAKGAVPTPSQALLQMGALLAEKSVSQTSVSYFQVDGATVWSTYTLDSTSPSTIHRSA